MGLAGFLNEYQGLIVLVFTVSFSGWMVAFKMYIREIERHVSRISNDVHVVKMESSSNSHTIAQIKGWVDAQHERTLNDG